MEFNRKTGNKLTATGSRYRQLKAATEKRS